jgi:hypothetical protein
LVDSNLVKFLGENIGRLQPFDYFLILVMVVLIGLGVYFIISSIYRQVIAAQEKLITIKDKTIEHHEKTLSSLAKERAELKKANSRVEQQLEKIRTDLQTQSKEHNQQVNDLVKGFRILVSLVMLARIGLLQLNILHCYRVRAAILVPYSRFVRDVQFRSPTDIAKEIDDLIDKVFEALEVIKVYGAEGDAVILPDEVPDSVFQFVTVDIDHSRLAIKEDLRKTEPIISEQMEKLVKQIQAQPSK